jgi:hypothetical protein
MNYSPFPPISHAVLDVAASILKNHGLEDFTHCVVRSLCCVFECGTACVLDHGECPGRWLALAAAAFCPGARVLSLEDDAWVAIDYGRNNKRFIGESRRAPRIVSAVARKNCAGGLVSFFIKSLYHPSAVRVFNEFYGSVGVAQAVKIMHGFRTLKAFGSVRICGDVGESVSWPELLESVYGMDILKNNRAGDSWMNFFSVRPDHTFSSDKMDFFIVRNHGTIIIASCPRFETKRDMLCAWAERHRVSFLDTFDPEFVVDSLFLHECRFVCGSLTVNGMCAAMRELVLAVAGDESLHVESRGGGKMYIARDSQVRAIASCSKGDVGYILRVKRVNDESTRRLFLLVCELGVNDPLAVVDAFSPFELLFCASYVRTSFLFVGFSELEWLRILEIVIGSPVRRAEAIPENFEATHISSLLTWLCEWNLVFAFVGRSSFLMERVGQRWMFVYELNGNQVMVSSSCVMGKYFLGF